MPERLKLLHRIYNWLRLQTFVTHADFADEFWPNSTPASRSALVRLYAHKMRKLGLGMRCDRARGYHVTLRSSEW
jgi:hypothetical protein